MEENKMIMDDVVETKVSDTEMANAVTYSQPMQQYTHPRKIRTIIRKFDKKVMPNDPCPCGAVDENGNRKKFKKCCKGNGEYDGTRELTAQEMAKCRYENKPAWRFKEQLNK